jgi:hypothetical protein
MTYFKDQNLSSEVWYDIGHSTSLMVERDFLSSALVISERGCRPEWAVCMEPNRYRSFGCKILMKWV